MIAENPKNPNNLVAGGLYQYLSSYNSTAYYNTGVSGVSTSWDGGRTWSTQTLPINPQWTNTSSATCNLLHLADTAIAFGPNDTVYYVDLADSIGDQVCTGPTASVALYVSVSTDGGTTWGIPTPIAGSYAGAFIDKPWIAVDPTTGEVYVAYNDDSNSTITLRNSTDSGATWGRPVNLSVSGSGWDGLGVEIAVDPWGGVDASWYGDSAGGVLFSRSTDHGAQFSTPKLIGTAVSGASPAPDTFRAYTLPGIGVDDFGANPYTGRLFVTWQNGSGGTTGTPLVSLTYSSDNGTTWARPVTVNSNRTQESFQPDVAVGADGTVYAEWYGEQYSNGHYRLYGAESHDGGGTFDRQFAVSDNDSVPIYPTGGSAGWWIGDYTHLLADAHGARPLWTDARSPLSWTCSPCLWGVDYNISFYTAELTNASVNSNVPVNLTVNGTVPVPGNVSLGGSAPVAVDALIGETANLTAPATVTDNGSTWYFALWYGSELSTNLTLNATVLGMDHWTAYYVPTYGGPCRAAGAPGRLEVRVDPGNATTHVAHVATPLVGGRATLWEYPGDYLVQAWAVGYWSGNATGAVTPGNVTYVNLTLSPVPGLLVGTVSPAGATVELNGSGVPVRAAGTFDISHLPGTFTLTANLTAYAPYLNSSVTIRFNQTTNVAIVLSPLPGWINGTVAPGNATVRVDGSLIPVQNGSYSVREGPGTHWVNASATGYYSESSGPLLLVPFGQVSANLSLVLIVGTLNGSVTPATATVELNGAAMNVTGGAFYVNIAPGTYTLSANAAHYVPAIREVTVDRNATTTITFALSLAPGWIAGTVAPVDANVTLDGQPVPVDSGGAFNISASAGSHALNASGPGYEAFHRTITVRPGATSRTTISLATVAATNGLLTPLTLGLVALGVVAVAAVVGVVVWRRRRGAK